jgi:hypothetical protein
MLQAGRSRFQFPLRSMNSFSVYLIRIMALGFTQPLKEMSTRNLLGIKARPARKAFNFTDICEAIVYKMWDPGRLTTI